MPVENDSYQEILEFCNKKGDESLSALVNELLQEKINSSSQEEDDLLIEIADMLSGFPSFSETEYWNRENTEGLDIAHSIYRNLVKNLPEDRKTFCAFLEDCVYDRGG